MSREKLDKLLAEQDERWRALLEKPLDEMTQDDMSMALYALQAWWERADGRGDSEECERLEEQYERIYRRYTPGPFGVPIDISKKPFWI